MEGSRMKIWAFIYTLSAEATNVVRHEIGDSGCQLIAVGVPSTADGPAQVDRLIADGAELIECCGAFGPAETAAVQAAVAGRVPVGTVTYPCNEAGGLHRLFG